MHADNNTPHTTYEWFGHVVFNDGSSIRSKPHKTEETALKFCNKMITTFDDVHYTYVSKSPTPCKGCNRAKCEYCPNIDLNEFRGVSL